MSPRLQVLVLSCALVSAVGWCGPVRAAGGETSDSSPRGDEGDLHLFAGGLMFHLTPLKIRAIQDVDLGVAGGIGGGMQFYIGRHFRIGGLGESCSMRFGEYRSQFRAVMGALTVTGSLPLGPVDLDLGVAVGGQILTVNHLRTRLADGAYEDERTERTAFVLLPSLGVEIPVIRRLRILVFAHYYHPTWQDEFYDHAVTVHLALWFNTYVMPRR